MDSSNLCLPFCAIGKEDLPQQIHSKFLMRPNFSLKSLGFESWQGYNQLSKAKWFSTDSAKIPQNLRDWQGYHGFVESMPAILCHRQRRFASANPIQVFDAPKLFSKKFRLRILAGL